MIEAIFRRDRAVTLAGLAVLTALAWAYLLLVPVHAHGPAAHSGAPLEPASEMSPAEAVEEDDSLPP